MLRRQIVALVVVFLVSCLCLPDVQAAEKPNIVFILADDLGYGDVGCFGQAKIRTPHIDRLAKEGMRFTRHYSGNAVCAPSRCVLMTGKHPGHAFIRDNRELKPEGQHPIPAGTVTLPTLLKQHGYATGGFGKWGLGGPGSAGEPLRQGFDRFFGYNCQRVAHNYYPTFLWDNDRRLPLNNPEFLPHQKMPADAKVHEPASYGAWTGKDYAPDLIADQAVRFIHEHRDQPFFLYFPTTIPHLALQVPDDALAEYRNAFPEEPYLGDRGYLPHRTPRAAYAALVTRLDSYVGRLLQAVHERGLDERTVFVFSSDNGPLYDALGGTDTDFFQSAGALRGRKGSLYEGGVRVPTIVRWRGQIPAGASSSLVTGFEDWLPTLLELVGLSDATPPGLDGVSLVPTLRGQPQPPREFLYREFPGYGGQQALWIGPWKAIRTEMSPRGKNAQLNRSLELYHLDDDPAETQDVAAVHPDVVAKIQAILRRKHSPSPDFPFPALDR